MKIMKLFFPLMFMVTQIIAIKVLTTTDDLKKLEGNSWIKLDIKGINGVLKLIMFKLKCNYQCFDP